LNDLVSLVIGLALIEYLAFSMLAGKARSDHGVEAPAITGHPDFERKFRVQQNTLEQLMIFLPSLVVFQIYWNPNLAALMGLLFLVGRILYFRGYVADPAKRTLGFGLGFLAQAVLLIGAILGASRAILG